MPRHSLPLLHPLPLSGTLRDGSLSFVIYTTLTINITQWRKKFRTGQNKSDNRYHDIATDSLVNFETVKYFANEELECRQFSAAVKSFQAYNIGVQASLSLLNSSQQLDIQLTTLAALCLAASAILHQRATPDEPVQIGEFVSVNAYVLQLFAPLSFGPSTRPSCRRSSTWAT